MLEIEYELTLDDELDAFFATQKFKGKLPFFRWDTEYIIPAMHIRMTSAGVMSTSAPSEKMK